MTHKLYELKNPLRGASIYDAGTSYLGTAGLSEPGSEGAIAPPPLKGEISPRNSDFLQNQTEWLELIFGTFKLFHSVLRLDATQKKGSMENSSNSKNLASNKQLLLVAFHPCK